MTKMNSEKRNISVLKIIGVAAMIAIFVYGVVLTYGAMCEKVKNNTKNIESNAVEIEMSKDDIGENEKCIAGFKSDITYIKEAVKRIEEKL